MVVSVKSYDFWETSEILVGGIEWGRFTMGSNYGESRLRYHSTLNSRGTSFMANEYLILLEMFFGDKE